jgi:translation initiation factor IF-3
VQTKQIELNWAIDAHDLAHRLKQLTNFLEKGRKVEVIMKRKKAKRSPTVEEIKQVIQSVLDTTREAGGTQVKAMEGEPGKQVIITVKKET